MPQLPVMLLLATQAQKDPKPNANIAATKRDNTELITILLSPLSAIYQLPSWRTGPEKEGCRAGKA